MTVTFVKGVEKFKVTATKEQKENPAVNAVDGNPTSRWSAEGKATITIDLGKIVLLDAVKLNLLDYLR